MRNFNLPIINALTRAIYRIMITAIICLSCYIASAQQFNIPGTNKRQTVPFKLVRSMVVIQLKINGKGPFNFILDTGVGLMVITDEKLTDSLHITNKRTIKISGLGEREDYEALIAPQLNVNIQGLVSSNVSAAILQKDHFGLSNYAGMPIHGLLGYDFFSQLAVKINFTDTIITVSRPKDMQVFRKATRVPINIQSGKPYMNAGVVLPDGIFKNAKLLIDLGAGHALSMENIETLPQNSIPANLGIGLNGLIQGHINRIKEISIGNYKISNIISSFPSESRDRNIAVSRDGSVGIGILKRFNIIFNYAEGVMYLKPNLNFKEPSEHDMSGLGYYLLGKDYQHLIVETVDKGSPGDESGIEVDDEITAINFRPVSRLNMQQIDDLFRSRDGRSILIEICRKKNTYITLAMKLRRRI